MDIHKKLAELHKISSALDKVVKSYCADPVEKMVVKEISIRLYQEQILPLAEVLVKDTKAMLAKSEIEG